jgi:hypothetical protein
MLSPVRLKLSTLLLVCASAAPVTAVALWSITRTVISLSDPCATWDYPPDRPMMARIKADDPCRTRSIHTESKARAVIRAALPSGWLLGTSILAISGAAFKRRRVMIAAGICMLSATPVVFSIFPLTLLAGLSFLHLANRIQPGPQGVSP